MYIPRHFEGTEEDARRLAKHFPFATLISAGDEPMVSHVPLVLRGDDLIGHLAKANPHWRLIQERPTVLAIFHGPHAYVSHRDYATQPQVPTWNYAVAHAHGHAQITEAADLETLIQAFGEDPATIPADYTERIAPGIVGLRIRVERWEAKLKLSQNKRPDDRVAVIEAMEAREPEVARALTDYGFTVN